MSTDQQDRLLVKERLSAEGVECRDLYALLKRPEILRQVAPLLMDLLAQISSLGVREDLIRLASQGGVAPERFLNEVEKLRPMIEAGDRQAGSLGWTLVEALSRTADASVYENLGALLRNRRLGRAREMLPYALENVKSRRQETIQILLEVLDDEDVTAHAVGALAKLKAVEAIPAIRKCLASGVPLVRREAAKALKKLGKVADQPADDDVSPFSPASRPPHEGSVESSTCFDLDQVVPFLDRVAALVKGFGPPDIQRIESCLLDMEPDQEASFDFQVRHQGDEMPLQIRIYMDDIDTPDMAFFTSPELAEAIDQLMDEQE